MSNRTSSLVVWLAGLNAFLSVYVLWTFYRALQYMPATESPPLQLRIILWILLLFEVVSILINIVYIKKRKEELVHGVYGVLFIQILAVTITPFLIAATVMPRV